MASRIGPTDHLVYILREEETHHSGDEQSRTIGVYKFKEAAMLAATLVETPWGSINKARSGWNRTRSVRIIRMSLKTTDDTSPRTALSGALEMAMCLRAILKLSE